jgi:nucleoside-diphosphate-sugar epimerase
MQISPILGQETLAQRRHILLQSWQEASVPEAALALAGKRVLLTGSNAQLGVWALRQLLKAGAEVDAIIRNPLKEPLAHPNLHWHQADLTQENALQPLAEVRGLPPLVVFCAMLWLLPAQLPAMAAAGVRQVVAFSSTSLHVKAQSGSEKERALVARLQEAEAKAFAWAAEHGVTLTILRPTLIYGIGLDNNVNAVARVLRRLRFFPVALAANGLRQPVHVDDLTQAVFACLANPDAVAGKAYDLAGGEVLGYHAFVQRIAAIPGVGGMVLPVPFLACLLDIVGKLLGKSDVIHGEIVRRMRQNLVFSSHEAEQDFGYQPRGFLAN